MEKVHTPGPWSWDDKAGDAGGLVVRSVTGDRIARVCWWGEQSETPWATEANARLIATAPEILKALETLTDYAERNGAHVLGFRSLIAKATGKA